MVSYKALNTLQESVSFVLIVPYGIETPVNTFGEQLVLVLIVPYGIETPWKAQLRR